MMNNQNNQKINVPTNIGFAISNDGSGAQMIITVFNVQFSVFLPSTALRGLGNKILEIDSQISKMIINPNDKGFKNVD